MIVKVIRDKDNTVFTCGLILRGKLAKPSLGPLKTEKAENVSVCLWNLQVTAPLMPWFVFV